MAYGRPFAYDPTGSTVPTGTQKFGDLLIGEDLTLDYYNDYAGYKWYNGPDESIYWVIARYYSGASQNFDFWGAVKTNDAIEPNLTGMTYYLSNFTELIDNPRGCKTWLNDNNYWTSYGESTSPLILNLDATSYLSLIAPKSSATQWLDISGHINDATFSGATEYTSNPEKMQLTGFNFFVVNNNIDLLSPTNYTKIIWVNYSSLGNNTDILSGRYVDGGSSNFHRLWAGDSSYGSYKFRAGHTGSGDTVESTTIVSANTWYCVAVTFDTTNGWSLYVNGSSEDTNSDTTTFSYSGTGSGSGAIQVGAFNQSNKMSGYISQVRVYNSALTQTQIQEFYNQTRNIYEATPILTDGLKLQLDASISSSFTTGTTKWYDISGLGNNGDFNNTITYSGDASGSFVFDSGSGYIEIPTSSSLNLGPSSTFATIQMWVKISNFSSDIPYILQKYDNSLGGYYIGTTTRKIPENTPLDLKNQIFMGNFGKLNESDPFPSGNYIGTYNSGYTAYTYPSYSNNDWVFVTFQVANSVSPGFMVGLAFTGNSQFQQTSFQVGNRNNDKPLVIGNNYPQGVSSFSAFSGSIGAVYLYQKLLTNSEILQNYNATNDRFSKPDITPSPTPTQTITPTFTPTATITPTPSITPTQTLTPTNTLTQTTTPTPTPSSTPSSGGIVTSSLFMELDASNYTSGTWSDETGNGNNATINGATWLSTDGGIFDLDGINDTISIPHNSSLSLSTSVQKTIQVWVKFDSLPGSGQQVPVLGKLSNASGFDGYWSGLFSNGGVVRCTTNGTAIQKISDSVLTVTTNTWYLFTFISQITSTANTTKVYINTTEYISTAHGSDGYSESNPLYLGFIGTGVSSLYLNGKIGACYFYTKGLNTSEITQNFDTTKSRFGY